jgi:ABC-type multidrug transport system ATPase subunit
MITTDVRPDAGWIEVCGEQLSVNNLETFYKNVSLCPQHNPFWEEITLYEHLVLYASIKNMPEYEIEQKCHQ